MIKNKETITITTKKQDLKSTKKGEQKGKEEQKRDKGLLKTKDTKQGFFFLKRDCSKKQQGRRKG